MKKTLALLMALVMLAGLTASPVFANGDGSTTSPATPSEAASDESTPGALLRFVFWHPKWVEGSSVDGGGYNKYIIEGISNDADDEIIGHAGETEIIALPAPGSGEAEYTYVPDELNDDGIRITFCSTLKAMQAANIYFEEDQSEEDQSEEDQPGDFNNMVIALIEFTEWESEGTIRLGDNDIGRVKCGKRDFDFYESLKAEWPISGDWQHSLGDEVYIRPKDDGVTFVRYSADTEQGFSNSDVSFEYDENGKWISVSINDSVSKSEFLAVGFEFLRGEETERDHGSAGIYVNNRTPHLVFHYVDWDERGDLIEHWDWGDNYELDLSVPVDRLGSWAFPFVVRFFDGDDYSDPLGVDDLEAWGSFELNWDQDTLWLLPYSYDGIDELKYEYTVEGNDGENPTDTIYTMPVHIQPATTVFVQSVGGKAGDTVTVDIKVDSMTLECSAIGLRINYDRRLTLVKGSVISQLSDDSDDSAVHFSSYENSGECYVTAAWASSDDFSVSPGDTLLTLKFAIPADVNDDLWIDLDGLTERDDGAWCTDVQGESIAVQLEGGRVRVRDYIAGDLNNDGRVTTDDAMALLRWLVGWGIGEGEDYSGIKESMTDHLDINGDGRRTLVDVTRLLQYIAGWHVEIY